MSGLAWRQAVVSLRFCVLCGADGVQAAHRNEGKGMSMKTGDHLCAALCPTCHHEIDNGPGMTREERRAHWNDAFVRTFDQMVRRGIVRLAP